MPLTAYSTLYGKELDVEQLLSHLNGDKGVRYLTNLAGINDHIRSFIAVDIQCPGCFVTGAELVSGAASKKTGALIRQPCFRFTTPGHGKFCDFSNSDTIKTPENLIDFGKANNSITRQVRVLVCSAIELGIINQVKIRDMREWFYKTKTGSSFEVNLDTELPIKLLAWIRALQKGSSIGTLPASVELSKDIAAAKGFDWKLEAHRQLYLLNRDLSERIQGLKLWQLHDHAEKVSSIIKINQKTEVFDPTVLKKEYQLTIELTRYINHYLKLPHNHHFPELRHSPLVAFNAVLLYVNDWNMTNALEDFAKISLHKDPDLTLGNVMGLNPFHEYQAWRLLKELQNLPEEIQKIEDVSQALGRIETNLIASFS